MPDIIGPLQGKPCTNAIGTHCIMHRQCRRKGQTQRLDYSAGNVEQRSSKEIPLR